MEIAVNWLVAGRALPRRHSRQSGSSALPLIHIERGLWGLP